MLNESNSKKLDSSKEYENQQPVKTTNPPTLLRQSSLQNLKIKNFFTFGNKWKNNRLNPYFSFFIVNHYFCFNIN